MTYIWIIVGLLIIFILWTLLEQRMIVNSKYIIHSDKLSDDIDNLSFVVLADIHNKSFGKNYIKLIKRILEEKPDFVIIAGDMVTKRKPCYPGKAFNLIKEISEHYPVYYAYGNHEQYFEDLAYAVDDDAYKKHIALYEAWSIYKVRLKRLGVFLLDNNSIILQYNNSKLIITGLSISNDFYARGNKLKLEDEIQNKIGNSNNEGYQVLIAHNPIYFKEYIEWGADLIISGHMHGGIIRLPFVGGIISPQVKLFPKYDSGQHTLNDSHMVISRGLGSHSFMPRIFNPPELVQIKLKKNE
jgi:predicted MPP superfamily phosphohydrolase